MILRQWGWTGYVMTLLLIGLSADPACGEMMWKMGMHGNTVAGGNLKRDQVVSGGAQLTYGFTDIYMVELAVDSYKAREDDAADTRDSILSTVLNFQVHLSPLTSALGVYLGAGLGAYADDTTSTDPVTRVESSENKMRIRPDVCLGLEYRLAEQVQVFGDYRYTFMNTLSNDTFNHGLARMGLNYCF